MSKIKMQSMRHNCEHVHETQPWDAYSAHHAAWERTDHSHSLEEACTSVMTSVTSLCTKPSSSASVVCSVPGACLYATVMIVIEMYRQILLCVKSRCYGAIVYSYCLQPLSTVIVHSHSPQPLSPILSATIPHSSCQRLSSDCLQP